MKKCAFLLPGISLLVLIGCGPSIKTDKAELKRTPNRGSLDIVVKAAEGIEPEDISCLKKMLVEKFTLAGFKPVEIEDSRGSAGREIELTVTKYEHAAPASNECVVAGAGCTYLCFLLGPCLLLPGYYHPQFEIIADVSAYRNGNRVFKKVFTEKSTSSANLVNTGNEEFKKQIEDLTIQNLTVALLKAWDRR